jgi:RsmE family RNA methyltransferase
MAEGDEIYISDGEGVEYLARLDRIRDEECLCSIISQRQGKGEPKMNITLYMAYPKGDKLETVIQKAVELGATRIVPFESSRCIKRPKADKIEKQTERLKKIAEEAAKQCGRAIIPEVSLPLTYGEMLNDASLSELSLICYERESHLSFKETLKSIRPKSISVIVGCEGGMVGKRHLGALGLLGSVAQKRDRGVVRSDGHAGIRGAHMGELDDRLGLDVGVCAEVEEDRLVAVDAGERQGERGALDALMRPMPKVAAVSTAPVEPAENRPWASPSATAFAAMTMLESFLWRTASAGCSDIVITLFETSARARSCASQNGVTISSSPTTTSSRSLSCSRAAASPSSSSRGSLSLPMMSTQIVVMAYLLGTRTALYENRPRRVGRSACLEAALLGDDDLAVFVVTTVGAHVMRKLGSAALRADRTAGSNELAVGRTTGMGGSATLLLLRNCHLRTSLDSTRPRCGRPCLSFARQNTIPRIC